MNIRPALIVSVCVLVIMFVASAWAWVQLGPTSSVPVHWGIDGTVDRYGGRFEGLLLLPLITLAVVVLFAVIPRVEPRRLNLEHSESAYNWIWIAIVCFLGGVHGVAVLGALGRPVDMGLLITAGLSLMYLAMGIVLPRLESNYLVGIRTPWTLASDLSWKRTHLVGGRLFILVGVVTLSSAALGTPQTAFVVAVGGVLVAVVVAIVYSYVVWRDDPDKEQEGR